MGCLRGGWRLEPSPSSPSRDITYLNVLARNHINLGINLHKEISQRLNLLPLRRPQVRPRRPSGRIDRNRGKRRISRGRRIPAAPVVVTRTRSHYGSTAVGGRSTSAAAKRAKGILLLLLVVLLLARMVRRRQAIGRGPQRHKRRIGTMRQAGRYAGRQGKRGGGGP